MSVVPSAGALAVLAERDRQKTVEGWSPEHDDNHDQGELADAAACYAATKRLFKAEKFVGPTYEEFVQYSPLWPFDHHWWKPTKRRRNLVIAGALIIAEIERLDRERQSK